MRENGKWDTVARQNYSAQSRADVEKIVKVNEKMLARTGEWEKKRESDAGGKRRVESGKQ